MKKLDKLVLGSFIGPFILTFFVVIFILLSQFMLRYFDEIIGKDLGGLVVAQLLFYFSIFMTPNGFPLAVLLSSLITFGNLGEHFELTAIKGAGINLIRTMLPIFIFSVLLTGVAYYSNNYIVPKAALKAFSLLYDVKHKKPAMEIKEGAFYNGIDGYSIKVNKKFGDGKNLKEIIIYDHTKGGGNRDVIVADSGRMYNMMSDRYMILELYDGHSYSEQKPERRRSTIYSGPEPYVRNSFSSAKLAFNMASFDLKRTKEELFAGNRMMKNTKQLISDVDSMKREKNKMIMEVKDNLFQNFRHHLLDVKREHMDARSEYFAEEETERDLDDLLESDRVNARVADTVQLAEMKHDSASKGLDSMSGTEEDTAKSFGDGIAGKINSLKMQKLLSRNVKTLRGKPVEPGEGSPTAHPELPSGAGTKGAGTKGAGTKGDASLASADSSEGSTEVLPDYSVENWQTAIDQADSIFRLESTEHSAVQTALTQVRHSKNQLNVQSKRLENLMMETNKFKLERYKKLSYAFTILTMFLIGAPLGSIIKRGGLGVPVIISIGFFILFYVISMVTEKYVKQNLLNPFIGAWMANIWLLPVGIFFLRQARIDARLLDLDYYLVMLQKITRKYGSKKQSAMQQ